MPADVWIQVNTRVPDTRPGSLYVWASSTVVTVRAIRPGFDLSFRPDPKKFPIHPTISVFLSDDAVVEMITSLRDARDGAGDLSRYEPTTLRDLLAGLEAVGLAEVLEQAAATITQLRACANHEFTPGGGMIEHKLISKASELRRSCTPTMRSFS